MNRLIIFMFTATGLGLVPGHTLAAEADQKAVAKGETVRLTIVTAQGGG
ncbi:MAG: hypothetical protein VCA38_04680 [Roseibacillus sp.]|jgi:hypothetical protein